MVNRDEWVPVSRQQLKHKIRGRSVYSAKFQAKKTYDLDDIRKFAKKTQQKLAQSNTVENIQITYHYSTGKHRGNVMKSIDEELDLVDYRNEYDETEYGEITGFTSLLC